MTYIINQLVKAGLIKRTVNPRDRRIKDTALTPEGEDVFRRCDEYIKNNVRDMFADLTEKELSELDTSLQKLKEIGRTLEQRGTAPPVKSLQITNHDRMEKHDL
jgi:DNA-binding MarR family transcriptional regulator